MALTMARPWRDPNHGVWHLRQRTPTDLLHLKGQYVTLPVGDTMARVKIGAMVQASLRTTDRAKAKELHVIADAALRRFWDANRKGAVSLSHKQAVALAGTLYRDWTGALSENADDPDIWVRVLADNARARAGKFGKAALMIGDEERRRAAQEERFGPFADALLSREGLVVDAASRERLVAAVSSAMEDASRSLLRTSGGDFSPDPAASRFPAWSPPAGAQSKPDKSDSALTAPALFELWEKANAASKSPATVRRYRASWAAFGGFLKGRDLRSLDDESVLRWAEHRRDVDGVSPAVVNKNDLVAVSSVMKWATKVQGGKRLTLPLPTHGVRLEQPKRVASRDRTFRSDEVAAILRAASAAIDNPDNPTLAYAKRWCPWLAAYSGARVAEVTGLLGSDIRQEAGVWVMDFTKTKTGRPRTVPLHEHLIDQGFLTFVRSRGDGPLFYDPTRHKGGRATSPAELRGRHLADWVREVTALPPEVDPNHGWRHTWKTRALEADIQERLRDAITGHRIGSVSRQYEAPTVPMLAKAMSKFPRYVVD